MTLRKRGSIVLIWMLVVVSFLPAVIGIQHDLRGQDTVDTVPTGVARIGLALDQLEGTSVDADVAIVDTGVGPNTDLNVVGGIDCSPSSTVGGFRNDWSDHLGHGTHVAGIIGAKADGKGIVGVAPGVRLWAVKVFNDLGITSEESVLCGLHFILSHPQIRVVNMSMGGPIYPRDASPGCTSRVNDLLTDDTGVGEGNMKPVDPPADNMHDAVCRLHASGVTIVVAAGNEGTAVTDRMTPATYDEVITVSSMADFDGKAGSIAGPGSKSCDTLGKDDDNLYYDPDLEEGMVTAWMFGPTNYGSAIDIAAPGVCIFSTLPNDEYGIKSGTSMAAPHVTGAIARYLAENPTATVDAVRGWLLVYGSVPQTDEHGFGSDTDGSPEHMLYLQEEK